MTTRQFLLQLQAVDVRLFLHGEELKCDAPRGLLTEEIIAELVRRKPEIVALLRAGLDGRSTLVPIRAGGTRRPLFGFPGHNGDVCCWIRMARELGPDRPFLALEPPGLDGSAPPCSSVEELAARFVTDLRQHEPHGPYLLAGYCAGGTIAFEVAQQLLRQGETVAYLGLFESPGPRLYTPLGRLITAGLRLRYRAGLHRDALRGLSISARAAYLSAAVGRVAASYREACRQRRLPTTATQTVAEACLRAVSAYRPTFYPGRLSLYFHNRYSMAECFAHQLNWAAYCAGVDTYAGPDLCVHDTLLLDPHVREFARMLDVELSRISA